MMEEDRFIERIYNQDRLLALPFHPGFVSIAALPKVGYSHKGFFGRNERNWFSFECDDAVQLQTTSQELPTHMKFYEIR